MKKTINLCVALFMGVMGKAEVKLPSVFSDNMLLQQNCEVAVWGKANPLENVSVKPSWSSQAVSCIADQTGRWELTLKTPEASGGHSMQVSGENNITINNILVGEVWLCSGQSNMEFQVAKERGWLTGIIDEDKVLADSEYPSIRLFKVKHTLSPVFEQDDCEGKWVVCTPDEVRSFSAVAFLFGRRLHNELQVPVGLIQSTWGGTHAESWTKWEVVSRDPVNKMLIEEQAAAWRNYPRAIERYDADKANHDKLTAELAARGEKPGKGPSKPKDPNNNKTISSLWNGMLNPLVPYTIKGVIWYQGESNSIRHQDYTKVFTNMIESWREEFRNNQMPFYFVQIAPHYKQPAEIRDAQLQTWINVPNTGMAVITDCGDSTDIHPRNKITPADRLARWALAKDYGREVAYSGPLYQSLEIQKNKAIVSFDHLFGGLSCPDKVVKGFEVAGEDMIFYPATAIIKNDKVMVSAREVKLPVHVRYGWGKFFHANLCNQAGLPASPFKSY